MDVVNEAVTLCRTIHNIVSRLQEIEEDWHTVSDVYKSKVIVLNAKLTIVKDHVDDRALPEANSIVQILRSAEAKVRKEQVKVEALQGHINNDQCCGWGWWVWAKVSALLFPDRLERTVKDVIEEINTIPEILKLDEDISSQFFKFDQRQAFKSTFYDNDGLYVPLERTQYAVIHAIEKGLCVPLEGTKAAVITPRENGRLVVLLHGGVGTGKTVLAKYVCKYYQGTTLFDHVHWELCGPDSIPDPSTKMHDILSRLSPTKVNDSPQNAQTGPQIQSIFNKFLKRKKILIILDHVNDENFLLEMWKVAQGCPDVKYLVTSQIPHLCHNLKNDTSEIAMRATTKDEARKILASLVGLDSRAIPPNLTEVADQVIAKTEGNPLALACWAGNFYSSQNKADQRAWWGALENLSNILNDPEQKAVLGSSQHRSLWEAMELCIKSTKIVDAKVIFFLTYACSGSSVPEEVLQSWHECIIPSRSFWKSREELSSRGLLKGSTTAALKTYLEHEDVDKYSQQSTAWALGPLEQLYMQHVMGSTNETMKKEILFVMDTFLGDKKCSPGSSVQPKPAAAITVESEKAKVAIALCALYFDPAHADAAVNDVAKRARSASSIGESDWNVIDFRKRAMEPIIWLLGQPKRTEWTEETHSSARKIFLTYICEHQVHGDGFAALLTLDAYPPAQFAAVTALLSVFTGEETMLHCENASRILQALLALLDSTSRYCTSFNEAAVKATEVVLGSLFKSFYQPDKPGMHLQAALALSVLAFGDKGSIGSKVMTENRAIVDLVKSLSKDEKLDLQEQVTKALRKITSSSDPSIDLKITKEEVVLAGLVKVLSEHEKSALKGDAIFTLWQLSLQEDEWAKKAIGSQVGALPGLIKYLSECDVQLVQVKAISILANVVTCAVLKPKLASEPGALTCLVRCLSVSGLQEQAARVLFNLSVTDSDSIKQRIRNEDGAITGLVRCLFAHNTADLRRRAAGVLANLADDAAVKDDAVTLGVANEAEALEGLLKSLSERENPRLQVSAAKALRIVACSKVDAIKLKLIEKDQALASLVDSLSQHDNDKLQMQAADVIWYLAEIGDDSHKKRIRDETGLLPVLVSLTKLDNSRLQKNAKGALRALGEADLAK